jgi:hypothetical protein
MWNPWLRYALMFFAFLPKLTNAVGNFSMVNFSSSVLQQSINSNGTTASKDINIYYAIFAGRKDVMKIHFQYTDIMLQLGLVTEVHIWDFTNGNTADCDYLTSYMRDTVLPGYRLYEKPSLHSVKDASNAHHTEYLWYSFYEHYLNNKRYRPQDILIKADDDIVYIHMSSFQAFVDKVRNSSDNNLHFPNIINNDVGFVVQFDRVKHEAPELEKWMNYYTVNPHQFDFRHLFNDFYTESNIKGAPPITSKADGVYRKGEFSYDMHRVFLRNPSLYLHQLHVSKLPRLVPFNQRISINMYAAKFDVICLVYKLFLEEHCCMDEKFIGVFPTLTHNSHIIHVEFVVSHLAFGPQYKDPRTLQARLDYAELASVFTKEFSKLQSTR